MQKFNTVTGIAAPLPINNVDTDMIIPKQFLRTIKRTGLGVNLFDEMRYDDNGQENPDFVLNQAPYNTASILVSGENFGCGSSREHAPWALMDFGFRCVIAPSFADIFYNNCFKNGILPITLEQGQIDLLMTDAKEGLELTIDLENNIINRRNQGNIDFEIEPFRRNCLLNGLDDIGLTLQQVNNIDDYEEKQSANTPWL